MDEKKQPAPEAWKVGRLGGIEERKLVFRILDLLHGLPLCQALGILEHRAPDILRTGQRFETNTPEFQSLRESMENNKAWD